MQSFLLVAIGGGLGAAARYGLSQASVKAFGSGFPIGTMSANVIGSFLMGLLAGWLATQLDGGQNMRLFLGVGLLGGFTTFSAFSLEAWAMMEKKAYGEFALYAGSSVLLAILALVAGLLIARQVFA